MREMNQMRISSIRAFLENTQCKIGRGYRDLIGILIKPCSAS